MFFLIPVGSEEGVRRWPFATIGLIAVNVIIWLITALVINGQIKALERKEQEIINFLAPHMFTIMESAPDIMNARDVEEAIRRIDSLDLFPRESEEASRWHRLTAEFRALYDRFLYRRYGLTPRSFNLAGLLTYMFIHGGFFHLAFNMLYLWMVGCNIEDDWSWKIFLGLYLVSGGAAGLMHAGMFPGSGSPLVGASGAVAGIMGAFMIRHFKTKIRFAYFFWVIIARPYFGTFSLYAGIALPIWFLGQFLSIQLTAGAETGTAYWAHVGGFLFGLAVGIGFKFLGIEKKYIAPMVEDSFEQLKLSAAMKEANRLLETGDRARALDLLRQVVRDEPDNADASQTLARLCLEGGLRDDAIGLYNRTLERLEQRSDQAAAFAVFDELLEKNLIDGISEKNLYGLARALDKTGRKKEAAGLYEAYERRFPAGRVRAKVLARLYRYYRDDLQDGAKAALTLETLKKEFPDFPVPSA